MLCTFLLVAVIIWAVLLLWFVHGMPSAPLPASVRTDAIIVLTGGRGRVERGFSMLAEGAAPVMMVSGVGKSVTLNEMLLAHASPATRAAIHERGAAIVFDYVALTTHSNAREAAQFVAERRIRNVRLITAHYHMRRSIAEMRAAMPEVEFVPDPVFPEGFQRERWWRHENSRTLVLSEFHKYLAVRFRPLLQSIRQ